MTEETLFHEALARAPAERAAFLEQVYAVHPALRAPVDALLAAHEATGDILGQPDPEPAQTVDSDPGPTVESRTSLDQPTDFRPSIRVGGMIAGRYTLQQRLGEGGMGEVWVAKQTSPVKRNVALKLIKAGMDSRAVVQRFEQERQALALMDHPNIARVFDAGLTNTGQPFFVMELVNGLPLIHYCDAAKLTPRQRLELFVPICKAVQHAHQKGIVHRDLKPANILVTMIDGRPVPKVIDFGVAKATSGKLTEETMSTSFGAVVGTLEYMSPEQAGFSGEDVDTRADIYSLGVILYELLTGLRPIDAGRLRKVALAEMIRIIQSEDPSKPSTRLSTNESLASMAALRQMEPKKLMAILRGELDWIIMKCLEKQRDRRYDTANALVRDIERYLGDEVVEARPPSAGYRLKKYVRRHMGQVIAASLVLLVLVGGVIGTSIGLVRAKIAGAGEKAQREKAENLAATNAKLATDADKARDKAEYQLGINNLLMANAAYGNDDVQLAAERLDLVPVKQRGWDWNYLKQQTRGGLFTMATEGPVACVAYSPDGTRIASLSTSEFRPAEAKVWDARTGLLLFELAGMRIADGFTAPEQYLAWSPDGSKIAAGSGSMGARIYDAHTGAYLFNLEGMKELQQSMAFSPDSKRLAAIDESMALHFWDAATGKRLETNLTGANNLTSPMAFSPDGTRLVACKESGMKVWDAKSGVVLLDHSDAGGNLQCVAFDPQGKRIILGRQDATVSVMDAQTGASLLELKGVTVRSTRGYMVPPFGVVGVSFSPDGKRLLTCGGPGDGTRGNATVWDAQTGERLLDLRGHTTGVTTAVFSPDGTRITTGGTDGMIKVWDARTGSARLDLEPQTMPVECAAFSPDDTRIITGGADGHTAVAMVFDARTGMPQLTLKGPAGQMNCVAFSPDGSRIATATGNIDRLSAGRPGTAAVWDARTGAALLELKGFKEGVNSIAFSPDGSRIVTGGATGEMNAEPPAGFGFYGGTEIKVWDAHTGLMVQDLTGPNPKIGRSVNDSGLHISFSPDGQRILVGGGRLPDGAEHQAMVIDVETGQTLFKIRGHEGALKSAAFSVDGSRIVTTGEDMLTKVWNASTGEWQLDLRGNVGVVNSAAFSPDGGRIVTGSGDGAVRVWDVKTGTSLIDLKAQGAVHAVGFSHDGTRIVSAGGNIRAPGEVTVWEAQVLLEQRRIEDPAEMFHTVAFSPDGTKIAAAGAKTLRVWDLNSLTVVAEMKGSKGENSSLAFSPDGARVYAGQFQMVKVWDARTGEFIANLNTGPALTVMPSADGTRLVTLDPNGPPKVWDLQTGQEIEGAVIPKTLADGRTSPDGKYFASVKQHTIEIIPVRLDQDEIQHRMVLAQRSLQRVSDEYLAARAAKDDFAAAFYLKLIPEAAQKPLLAKAQTKDMDASFEEALGYQRAEKFAEALPLLEAYVKFSKAQYGTGDPATINAMHTLAQVYQSNRQLEKAIPVLEEILQARKATFGLSDPQTVGAMFYLAMGCKYAGQTQKAIAVLEEAPASNALTRQQLSELYATAREYQKIIDLNLPQLQDAQTDPNEQPDLLYQLGRAYVGLQKWTEAEPLLRTLVDRDTKVSPDDWGTFYAQSMLGQALLGQKKYADAEPLLLKGYQGMKGLEASIQPEDAPRLPEAVGRLIELYTAMDKAQELTKWQAEWAKYPAPQKK